MDVNQLSQEENLHSKCLCVNRLPLDLCDSEELTQLFSETYKPVFCQVSVYLSVRVCDRVSRHTDSIAFRIAIILYRKILIITIRGMLKAETSKYDSNLASIITA